MLPDSLGPAFPFVVIFCVLLIPWSREDGRISTAITLLVTGIICCRTSRFATFEGLGVPPDVIHFIGMSIVMCGVSIFARSIITARGGSRFAKRARYGLPASVAALFVSFVFSHRDFGGSGLDPFMTDNWGGDLASTSYRCIPFLYGLLVSAYLGVTAVATTIAPTTRRDKVTGGLLSVASGLSMVMSADSLALYLAGAFHNSVVYEAAGAAQSPLTAASFGVFLVALTFGPALRRGEAWIRTLNARFHLRALRPVWEQATAAKGLPAKFPRPETDTMRLHRVIVEVRDAELDPTVPFTLTYGQELLLDRAEHELGQHVPLARMLARAR